MTTVEVITPAQERPTIERWRGDGGTVQTTFVLPPEPWDLSASGITCIAPVGGDDEAAAALVVALRRAALVVVLDPSCTWAGLDDFLDDLLRLRWLDDALLMVGDPSRSTSEPGGSSPAAAAAMLSADQRQILALLAEGLSLPDVAAKLYLSLRTAERRLGAARRLLGVRSTAEALVAVAGSDL